MLRVNWPTERTGKGAPGKSSPADFAFTCPRPPLRSFTKEYSNKKAPLKPLRRQRGLCRFFGANSVASALGIRSGATPCGLIQPNIQLRNTRSKPDILTLLGLGHFYFALTARLPEGHATVCRNVVPGSGRNFYGLDDGLHPELLLFHGSQAVPSRRESWMGSVNLVLFVRPT